MLHTYMSYPVQRSLWEGLESVFQANARNLLKDIANDLSRSDEKELLRAFSKDVLNVYLVEEEANEKECCAIETTSRVATRCRRAVYRNTCYCPLHLRNPTTTKYSHGVPKYKRLQTESGEIYFVDPVTQILYDRDHNRVGKRKEKKIILFKIDELSESRDSPDHVSNWETATHDP